MSEHEDLQHEIQTLATKLADASPHAIVQAAAERCPDGLALAFSGAEDVLVIDIAQQVGAKVRVFTLDTGRLHEDTYRYLEAVREHYDIVIDTVFPEHAAVERLVAEKGLFSFLRDGHKECCAVRKVAPLRRILSLHTGWLTGQRRDQSPDTRADVPAVQIDAAFDGRDGPLLKFNPLASWSSAMVWKYIRGAGIPYNPLHERGYKSIGCAPCTRSTLPGQHEREGRWWWELANDKECGLHVADVVEPR